MVKKIDTNGVRKRSITSGARSSKVGKKSSKKQQYIVSLKPSHPRAKKLNNYRGFLRYLFSGNGVDGELPDKV